MENVKDFEDLHEFMLEYDVHFHNMHGVEVIPLYQGIVFKGEWVLAWPKDWVIGTLHLHAASRQHGPCSVTYPTLADALLGLRSIYEGSDSLYANTQEEVTCAE